MQPLLRPRYCGLICLQSHDRDNASMIWPQKQYALLGRCFPTGCKVLDNPTASSNLIDNEIAPRADWACAPFLTRLKKLDVYRTIRREHRRRRSSTTVAHLATKYAALCCTVPPRGWKVRYTKRTLHMQSRPTTLTTNTPPSKQGRTIVSHLLHMRTGTRSGEMSAMSLSGRISCTVDHAERLIRHW